MKQEEEKKGADGFRASSSWGIGERWKYRKEEILADKSRETALNRFSSVDERQPAD